MHVLAASWGWLLLAWVIVAGATVVLQLRNMQKIWNNPVSIGMPFTRSFLPVMIGGLSSAVLLLLVLVGIIADLAGR